MRLNTFLNKNLEKKDFLDLIDYVSENGLEISTKEDDNRNLWISGFINKEYSCYIEINPLYAFRKGLKEVEYRKAFKAHDFEALDDFAYDFCIKAKYKVKGKCVSFSSSNHVVASYMKFAEIKDLDLWKMEYKEIMNFFRKNKLSIVSYKFLDGVRAIDLKVAGLNNSNYFLYLRVQLREEVVADFEVLKHVHFLLITKDFESLGPFIKNFYFHGSCKTHNRMDAIHTPTHVRVASKKQRNFFDYTEEDLYKDEDDSLSVDDIDTIIHMTSRYSVSMTAGKMLKFIKKIERLNLDINIGSSKDLSGCIVLEFDGFTDSTKAVMYAFLKEDSELSLDDVYDLVLNKDYDLFDSFIDDYFIFGHNSYKVVDSYTFGMDSDKAKGLFDKCAK